MPVGDDDFKPQLQPALPEPLVDPNSPRLKAPVLVLRMLGGLIKLWMYEETTTRDAAMSSMNVVNVSNSGTTIVHFQFLDPVTGGTLDMADFLSGQLLVASAPGESPVDASGIVIDDLATAKGHAEITPQMDAPGDYIGEITLTFVTPPADPVDRVTERFTVRLLRRLT